MKELHKKGSTIRGAKVKKETTDVLGGLLGRAMWSAGTLLALFNFWLAKIT